MPEWTNILNFWNKTGFTSLDVIALVLFLVCWIGYILFADYSRFAPKGIVQSMNDYRSQWMRLMVSRDVRIVDSQIMGNLLHSTTFLASTTILLLGGTIAALGAGDQAIAVLTDLPFTTATAREAWEIKVLLMAAVFVYAFFKFAWAMRLFNYGSILVGAAPAEDAPQSEKTRFITRTTAINRIAASNYSQGIRSYFFSVAALGWFLHPIFFMIASIWVVLVVYRREFRSKALAALQKTDESDAA